MSATCEQLESGAVELYFYDEMPATGRARMAAHIARCRECTAALGDLKVIRTALASRPDVQAPLSGDWSAFMRRLDAAVLARNANAGTSDTSAPGDVLAFNPAPPPTIRPGARPYVGLLATAALLALVTISVVYLARNRQLREAEFTRSAPIETAPVAAPAQVATTGMRSVGEQHFERSKLVVLGLASKAPDQVGVSDWAYERSLASSLLSDTRLYRMAAEQRGMTSLAGVMRDLELVLLETSMAEGSDPAELPQIQRLIRKRQLIQKMDVVNTVGLVP